MEDYEKERKQGIFNITIKTNSRKIMYPTSLRNSETLFSLFRNYDNQNITLNMTLLY